MADAWHIIFPEHVLEKTPNYALLRHAILGVQDEPQEDEQEDGAS